MSRKSDAVRRRLAVHGLRVVCLACRIDGRWFSELGQLVQFSDNPAAPLRQTERQYPPGTRLRDARCGRCGALGLRSTYWVGRHPELAAAARERVVALNRGLQVDA